MVRPGTSPTPPTITLPTSPSAWQPTTVNTLPKRIADRSAVRWAPWRTRLPGPGRRADRNDVQAGSPEEIGRIAGIDGQVAGYGNGCDHGVEGPGGGLPA